jgi:hypothetical protein
VFDVRVREPAGHGITPRHVLGLAQKKEGGRMPPVMQRVLDVVAAIALTAAAVFVIVALNAFLMSRGGAFTGFRLWYAFIGRPDIIGTMILSTLITFLYVFWQQRRRPRM